MSFPQTISLPHVLCLQSNHQKHAFEYICLKKSCVQHKQNPLCFYCLKQSHQSHKQQTLSLREFVSQCLQISSQRTNEFRQMSNEEHRQFYQLEDLLINGLRKCRNKLEMSAMLEQIYKATYLAAKFSDSRQKRLEKVLNHGIKHLRNETNNFYQQQRNFPTTSTKIQASLTSNTQFSIPILTFSNSLPSSQNFNLVSPFQITHNKLNSLESITAHPSMSTFCESVEVFIKVTTLTPNWMGIGICIGQHKYEEKSKQHITLLSNGWLNERGKITKNQSMRYDAGHVLRIQWNKEKKQLIFRNLTTRQEEVLKFEPDWNQDIFLCSTMFFKHDSIAIVQCGQE